jgi:hypothetical protein
LKARATLTFTAGPETPRITARMIEANGTAVLESRGANVTGQVTLWEQRAMLSAHFGESGWLPPEATLQADGWKMPGARLNLGDLYATVAGHGRIGWRDGRFEVDLAANGEPAAGKPAPPLEGRCAVTAMHRH